MRQPNGTPCRLQLRVGFENGFDESQDGDVFEDFLATALIPTDMVSLISQIKRVHVGQGKERRLEIITVPFGVDLVVEEEEKLQQPGQDDEDAAL